MKTLTVIRNIFLYILDHQSWLFTAILRDEYSPPDGLCFDDSCSDPPIMVRSKYFHLFVLLAVCLFRWLLDIRLITFYCFLKDKYDLYFYMYSRMIHDYTITMFQNVFKHSFKHLKARFVHHHIDENNQIVRKTTLKKNNSTIMSTFENHFGLK